ncbi:MULTISPECIES: hypothetical protein [Pseudomonas]|jgi:hypothetical protein|uniref:Uncharacterized protein n=1 Tax=Pseudomonas putida TaxID=303 RepID=A0A6B7Q2N6_PSEPU|nr:MULTISPECIES: hypothetical protein [Pseudomonas]MBA1203586.1 hypothetical protein [Pseudomonas capeferrum]QFX76604.1 hypothetical protein [Pseudomonas putida]
MADDFIRIFYRREAGGKSKKSSVSIDPLMFEIFVKIKGSIGEARDTLREWAKAADTERTDANYRMGNSRIVQQRMSQEILDMVNEGMAARAVKEAEAAGDGKGRGSRRGKRVVSVEPSHQLPAVTGHLLEDHG